MKTRTEIVEGKEYSCVYPEGLEGDINHQFEEIFKNEVYKEGRNKKDAVYVDIGANVGNASRYFYPCAKIIYAIEPNPVLYKALVENTKDLPNIKTFNFALSYGDGYDFLYSNEGSPFAQTIYGRPGSLDAVGVETKSIKTFLKEQGIDRIDVMKMDCEGAEYVILPSEGFREIAGKIDVIVGEAHHIDGGGFPQAVPLILNDYGFKTHFPKSKSPNFTRVFSFTDVNAGLRRNWTYREDTMFIAKRNETRKK